jgi:hypothetical protein
MNTRRSGYALLLVLLFVVLLLSLYSLAYRTIAASLRVETARSLVNRRDEGSVQAAARGLSLLETGLPPTDPYACGVTIETSRGPRSFTVTFTSEAGPTAWSVAAAPTPDDQDPPPMPATFAPIP